MNRLNEICGHCCCTFGAHLATSYHGRNFDRFFPAGCCPGHEGRMDWDKGPGTVFKPTGTYKEEKEKIDDN